MPLYFAYGANMDVEAMASRCPASRPLGLARLPRHRFFITADGYASILRDSRSTVHGVLWDLALGDVRALDRFEELDRGLYVKITQPVIAENGPRHALVYVGRQTQAGPARPGYLESLIASARHWALPGAYIAMLDNLNTARGSNPSPAMALAKGRASDTWRWEP